MTIKNTNIPTLRFAEFTDDWEVKKLGEISNKVMYGMNSSAIEFDGENKYLRITDIDDSSRGFIPKPLTSPDGLIEEKYKLSYGDIVFTRTGASVGKTYLYNPRDGNLLFAGFLIKFSITNQNPYFIFTQTLKDSFNKWVLKMSMRSGQPGLNAEECKELVLSIPTLPEQTKIANFLTAIDDKIQQLSEQKSLLEQYKKGIMQKIFSREIRFKPDTTSEYPDWEEKSLGDVVQIKYGKDQKQVICENGLYPILGTGGEIGRTNDFLCSKPSVLIGRKGTIDKPVFMDTPFWTVDTLFYTEVFENTFPKWLFYQFQLINWYLYNEASGVPSLSASTIYKISINLPSLLEQQKIATFLTGIDEKINGVKERLEATKAYKKGLLQVMFV